jgi:ankyrin repeat protein
MSHIDVNIQSMYDDNQYGSQYTAVMLAANGGHTRCVELLCQRPGIDLNKKDSFGRTALMLAILRKHRSRYENSNDYEKIVEILCKAGADVNLKDKSRKTAFYYALQLGREKCVEILRQWI